MHVALFPSFLRLNSISLYIYKTYFFIYSSLNGPLSCFRILNRGQPHSPQPAKSPHSKEDPEQPKIKGYIELKEALNYQDKIYIILLQALVLSMILTSSQNCSQHIKSYQFMFPIPHFCQLGMIHIGKFLQTKALVFN